MPMLESAVRKYGQAALGRVQDYRQGQGKMLFADGEKMK
jgi:hypothetical protein